MSLNKKLDELLESWESYKKEDVDEHNTSSAAGPYKTPNAFSKKKKEDENKNAEVLGYKKVKESTFMKMQKAMNEISYSAYKKDESRTSKNKVNSAIKEVHSKLIKIERIINQNIKLKTEEGIDNRQYWKSTRKGLYKISERMMRIGEKLRKF